MLWFWFTVDYLLDFTLRISAISHTEEKDRAGIHRGARTQNQGQVMTVQSLRAMKRISRQSSSFIVLVG